MALCITSPAKSNRSGQVSYLKHLVLDNFTELIFLPRTGEQDCLFSYFERLHGSLTECHYFYFDFSLSLFEKYDEGED